MLVAGYILVEKPDTDSMKWASSKFSDLIEKERASARLSAIVTDKEECLLRYSCIILTFILFQGIIFNKCQRLLCAAHLFDNLRSRLKDDIAKRIYGRLFGTGTNHRILGIVVCLKLIFVGLLDEVYSIDIFNTNWALFLDTIPLDESSKHW